MTGKVDLYDSSYANYGADVYREVRLETYGEDLGQTSWVTQEESAEIPLLLRLGKKSSALEVGCGSGGYALHLAEKIGCRVVGLDVNLNGIRNANELAKARVLAEKVKFEELDASKKLPFEGGTFDAAFANDVLCHLRGRMGVLHEMFRVLKPGGRILFSDALVIGGMVTHEEIAVRSSIGFYEYSPPGENQRLIEEAGFRLICAEDSSENAARIAKKWKEAREKRKAALVGIEGEVNFEGLQRFLGCVQRLTEERRLLRFLYVGEKAA
jgi:ubiquinone/menaquinone biosynthesis C-methylase UbiE